MAMVDPSTRAPAMAGGASLGMSPHTRRGVVLSERSESWFDFAHHDPERAKRVEGSKDDTSGAPGLPGGLHTRLGRHLETIAV